MNEFGIYSTGRTAFLTLRLLFINIAILGAIAGCATLSPVSAGPFPYQWRSGGEFCMPNSNECRDLTLAKESIAERNHLQHELLGTATKLCDDFQKELFRRTGVSVDIGVLSQMFSATASVLTHGQTAKQFAAAGGLAGTISGDFEKQYDRDQLSLALSGIELARTNVAKQILEEAKSDLIDYPVSRAINDVLRYHGKCSLQKGLNESSRLVGSQLKLHLSPSK